MKRYQNHLIGVDQGEIVLFADFEDGGDMWTGSGPRERRTRVSFSSAFKNEPVVHVSVSLWDIDTSSAVRSEISTENVTEDGFEIVFKTWLDTRVARARASWIAIGELPHPDDWHVD